MKIIQITDLHVASEGEDTYGVDVRQNFLDILKTAKSLSPDLLVLSGDLAFDLPDKMVYQWILTHLDFLEIPYTIIGGNHDDSAMLAKIFDMEHSLVMGELFYKRVFNGRPVLFLETSKGFVSEGQLMWLEHELAKMKQEAVVFMHHPPVFGGVPHMDLNYALQNMAEVQEIFFRYPRLVHVFCGHYHVDKTLCTRNLCVYITPSTYFQMDWQSEAFKIDHYRIGLREIILRADGVVSSMVVYREGNRV